MNSLTAAALVSLSAPAFAGPDAFIAPPSAPEPSNAGDFLKVTADIRARYEVRDTGPADTSHALTTRARIGLLAKPFDGLSAFVEGEFTEALVDDYAGAPGQNPGSRQVFPYRQDASVIGDPENRELNQAYLKYAASGFSATVGRQRIIRNGAQFIGNVGWRQNEQTYDAAQIGYSKDGLDLSYVYSNRVLRIFGNDPRHDIPLHDFEGDFHFFDIKSKQDFGTIGAYAYLIDVDANSALGGANNLYNNVGKSNSFGAFVNSNGLYAEFAFQDGSSRLKTGGDYTALYGHLNYTIKAGGAGSFTLGSEYLGENFKTPFATVHKFNGFADAFILQRIGLNNNGGRYNGLTDFYLKYAKKDLFGAGITFKAAAHLFMDGKVDDMYGYETDAVLVKKFDKGFSTLAKFAYFNGEDFYNDIKQASLQVDYKF